MHSFLCVKKTFMITKLIFLTVAEERDKFMTSVSSPSGAIRDIERTNLFSDVLQLFTSEDITREYPLRIRFKGELAIDMGGVFREMVSAFWEIAYTKCCDGDSLLVPLMHPGLDAAMFTKLGRILSHGYLQCGFLPLRIAFPALATMLLGVRVCIPNTFLVSAFVDSLNSYEQGLLKAGMDSKDEFACDLQTKLVAIVSRFGGRELPTRNNLKEIVLQLAKYQFQVKPLPETIAINAGIPDSQRVFWDSKTLADIYLLYRSMVVTPAKVIEEPESMNSGEQRIFTYLNQMVGDMKAQELAAFLRFVTGSSVCLGKKITVLFSDLTGLARRPIVHTCDCLLELPVTYVSYLEFTAEFKSILCSAEHTWCMTMY